MAISILENVDYARMSEVTLSVSIRKPEIFIVAIIWKKTYKQAIFFISNKYWTSCIVVELSALQPGGLAGRLWVQAKAELYQKLYGAHCLLVCCWTWKNGVGKLATCVANCALSSCCSLNCIRRLMA